MIAILLILLLSLEYIKSNILTVNFSNTLNNERNKRAVLISNDLYWKKLPIVYFVEESCQSYIIHCALQKIRKNTCLRFEQTNDKLKALLYFKVGPTYESNCGKYYKPPNYIMLPKHNVQITKIIREVFHTLGVTYENNRPDRNNYINVNRRYINKNYMLKFKIKKDYEIKTLGMAYDLRSIMHFEAREYSNLIGNSIEPVNKKMGLFMGQSLKPTFNDYKTVNYIYCMKPETSKVICQNYGYPDPKKPGLCRCLPYFVGKDCNLFIRNSGNCDVNNLYKASEKMQTIELFVGKNCYFFIVSAVKGKRIGLKLKLSGNNAIFKECNVKKNVEVRYQADLSTSGEIICPSAHYSDILSEKNIVVISSNYEEGLYKLTVHFREMDKLPKNLF